MSKKKEKIRQRRYIEKGAELVPKDKDSEKQGKDILKNLKCPLALKKRQGEDSNTIINYFQIFDKDRK